jgi:CubicO group peptidase (beta-lactamase class C family)
MTLLSRTDAMRVTILLIWPLLVTPVLAEPMHKPTRLPTARAESVGMSTEGLRRIDEKMREHIDAGDIQGGVTIVARHGKVVHFSTHGKMDVERGRAMEPDSIFIMASSEKPVIGVATMMLVDDGLISLDDPISKFIPEFADMSVAIPVEPANRNANAENGKHKGKAKEWSKGKGDD